MMTIGFAVRNRLLTRWGTAMPTKEMGPAKAVTQADRTLDRRISTTRKALMLTPIFWAYTSPI
ncbi:unknown [Firmicutes bacterium CAG:137]|nr:unknown [Firmicutes bacterium CAG:137]